MGATNAKVFVEIIAKAKGCILCDLALAILEETAQEMEPGKLDWTVVDVGAVDGIKRFEELAGILGIRPAVPSLVINQTTTIDHIPDRDELKTAVKGALG